MNFKVTKRYIENKKQLFLKKWFNKYAIFY